MASEAFKELMTKYDLECANLNSTSMLSPIKELLLENYFSSKMFCELIDDEKYEFPQQCNRFITTDQYCGYKYIFEYASPRAILTNQPKTVALFGSDGTLLTVFVMGTISVNTSKHSWKEHENIINTFGDSIAIDMLEYLRKLHPSIIDNSKLINGI